MFASGNHNPFERVPFFTRVTLESSHWGQTADARTVDVGLHGVGLICQEPLPVDQTVSLTFYLKDGPREAAELVVGRVVNVRFDDDVTIVGVEFSEPLSPRDAPVLVRTVEGLTTDRAVARGV